MSESELSVLSSVTTSLSKIYDELSKEIIALKDMDDLDATVMLPNELFVTNILRRSDEIPTFGMSNTARCCLIDGIQFYLEILSTRGNEPL